MILYHGSNLTVEKPDLSYSRINVDFGRGFYTTPIIEQAVNWALRFKRSSNQGIVTKYTYNDKNDCDRISVLQFDSYSYEWLDFIISCRSGITVDNAYDLIIGGVANDKIFDTIELINTGLINNEEALKRLRFEQPNIQYCFKNQKFIDQYLQFVSSEVI